MAFGLSGMFKFLCIQSARLDWRKGMPGWAHRKNWIRFVYYLILVYNMRVGNKINSFLNGEWAKHARLFGKKCAASKRRALGKKKFTIPKIITCNFVKEVSINLDAYIFTHFPQPLLISPKKITFGKNL